MILYRFAYRFIVDCLPCRSGEFVFDEAKHSLLPLQAVVYPFRLMTGIVCPYFMITVLDKESNE